MLRGPKVGENVVYHDENGRPFKALVTAVHGEPAEFDNGIYIPCINLLWVSGDKERQDSYGRQIERASSIGHKSAYPVHGHYWRFEDEEPNVGIPATT